MKVAELVSAKLSAIDLAAQADIAAIESKKVADKAVFNEIAASNLEEVAQARDEGYDLGQADSGVPAGDKKYTEADLQADRVEQKAIYDAAAKVQLDEVRAGLVEANAKIADLEVKYKSLLDDTIAGLEDAAIDNQLVVDKLKAMKA